MKRIENDCCGCATEGYRCIGDICQYRNVAHYYCDNCGEEFEAKELYAWNGQDYCIDCVHNDLDSDLEQAYPDD